MFWKTILITTLAIGALADPLNELEARKSFMKYLIIVNGYCQEVGAGEKLDEVATALLNYMDCVKDIQSIDKGVYEAALDVTLMNEIEKAKFKDGLNVVSKKFCDKTPQLKTCIHNLTSGAAPCLDNHTRIVLGDNTFDQLFDYLCYRDGERIVLFLTEGGPQCYQEKGDSIRECGMKLNYAEVNKLTEKEQCALFDELTACFVNHLEECSSPTAGNMAESLFRIVRRNMCI